MPATRRKAERAPRTLVVNLFGGPGTGKSTSAAAAFARLKLDGVNAELATEYAKDIVWEGRHYLLSDQIYIFAKQNRKLERLYGKVDVVVSDCPLLLSYYYSRNPHILGLVREMLVKADQLDVLLERKKPYLAKGRYQTESEARRIDRELARMLEELSIPYHRLPADRDAGDRIAELVEGRRRK